MIRTLLKMFKKTYGYLFRTLLKIRIQFWKVYHLLSTNTCLLIIAEVPLPESSDEHDLESFLADGLELDSSYIRIQFENH